MGGWSPALRVTVVTSLGVMLWSICVHAYRLGERSAVRPDLTSASPLPADAGREAWMRVHVAGSVAHPGVYSFRQQDRVIDAIERAGGAAKGARLDDLNLAAKLRDGLRLYVPGPNDGGADRVLVVTEDIYVRPPPPARAPDAPPAGEPTETYLGAVTETEEPAAASVADRPSGPVDINHATLAELETLPGVGPVLAGRIVAYRETHGPFGRPEDLQAVRGIGEKTYEKLAPYLVVR